MDPEGRTLRTARLLLHLLQTGRVKTGDAAGALETEPRNVTRDLQLLSTLVPLKAVGRGRRKCWVLDPEFGLRHIGILDRISLVLGREITSFLQGTALYEGMSRVEPDGLRPNEGRFTRNLDRKIRHLQEPARSYTDHRDTLDTVLDALLQERTLHLSYASSRGDRAFVDLQPLTVVIYRRAVYLFARAPDGACERLAVERIRDARLGSPFPYPSDWDPDAEIAPWFGMVTDHAPEPIVLRFRPKVHRYVVARRWHDTATLHDLPDGGVELRMRAGGSELVRWVLEWGENCVVVRPTWLREAVIRELAGGLGNYFSGSDPRGGGHDT